jgi:hypothetical protein
MSEHKATPEQWGRLEQRKLVGNDLVPAVLELRARVEALEAAQRPLVFTADEVAPIVTSAARAPASPGESEYTDAEWAEIQRWGKTDDSSPAPAGSLALPGFFLDEFVSGVRRIQSALAPVVELHTRIEAARAEQAAPAPARSLVERVADALDGGTELQARAAIREVAAWFRRGDAGAGSAWTVAADVLDAVLREEADRSTSQEG